MSDNQTILSLKSIKKSFDDTKALKGINLDIKKAEFLTLLGPSGCGKTTTLKIISGLLMPDEGRLFLQGEDITALEPSKRDMHTVFQSYALFPHMNIYNNIAYSLKIKKMPKNEISKKVSEVLSLVQLSGFEKRMPKELSGGQQQRIAIARAIVSSPKVVLLDEPLGALDLQLRRQLQAELKSIQKSLGITFVYITHDQEEALNMSDRIVVMNEGKLLQIGSPRDIYNHPKTSFVAKFIGEANILKATILKIADDFITVKIADHSAVIKKSYAEKIKLSVNASVNVVLRSENIYISDNNDDSKSLNHIPATVVSTHFAGGQLKTTLQLSDGTKIIATRFGSKAFIKAGASVYIGFSAEEAVLTDLEVA